MADMDKSLFFITLFFICVWLIVDMAIGKNHLQSFLATIFPFMSNANTATQTVAQTNNAQAEQLGGAGYGQGASKPAAI